MLRVLSLPRALRRLAGDRSGATAIEYALIAALVSIGMLAGLTGTNASVAASFENLMERVSKALGT